MKFKEVFKKFKNVNVDKQEKNLHNFMFSYFDDLINERLVENYNEKLLSDMNNELENLVNIYQFNNTISFEKIKNSLLSKTKVEPIVFEDNFYTENDKIFSIFNNRKIRKISDNTIKMLNAYEKPRLVEINNLDITYGSGKKAFRAVKDFNLNIYDGEVLGLVGESGSGKSTIGKALVGLIDYSFGSIKIANKILPKRMSSFLKFGKELKEYKDVNKFMIDKVQMIFQNPTNSLNPHKNIQEVISEGLKNLSNSQSLYLYNYDSYVFNKVYTEFINPNIDKFSDVIKFDELLLKIKESDFHNDEYYHIFINLLNDNNANKELINTLIKFSHNRKNIIENIYNTQLNEKLILTIINQVGMDESILKRYPLEFSGGQQQRIGIARSIVLRPKLLVADEPISALDVSIQAQVVNIFNDLKEKYNLTILFIAHDLRMVEYISDRIAVMNKGTLLEVGPTHAIMNNPIHPYTKSLLDAIPSIDGKKGSLIGRVYDSSMHKYSKDNQPDWLEVEEKHFVLATQEEIEEWTKKDN